MIFINSKWKYIDENDIQSIYQINNEQYDKYITFIFWIYDINFDLKIKCISCKWLWIKIYVSTS